MGRNLKIWILYKKGIKVKEEQKVIDVIKEYGDYIPLKKGRKISAQQLLERFLFDRKKQYDFVNKLSGGEKKRLYLCTVLIQNPNFLILDEPTNDLDIITLNVLESFLLDFPGCLIVVSHDIYFMDKIVDHLFVFKGDGVVNDFPGNYSDFRAYEDSRVKENKESLKNDKKESVYQKETKEKVGFSYKEQKEFKKLELDIKKIEIQKKEIQNNFIKDNLSAKEIENLSIELGLLEKELESKTQRWFELSEISE